MVLETGVQSQGESYQKPQKMVLDAALLCTCYGTQPAVGNKLFRDYQYRVLYLFPANTWQSDWLLTLCTSVVLYFVDILCSTQTQVVLFFRTLYWSTTTLSIIRYRSTIKWSNPENGVAPSSTPRCNSYWKGSLRVTLDQGRQLLPYKFVWYNIHQKKGTKINVYRARVLAASFWLRVEGHLLLSPSIPWVVPQALPLQHSQQLGKFFLQ